MYASTRYLLRLRRRPSACRLCAGAKRELGKCPVADMFGNSCWCCMGCIYRGHGRVKFCGVVEQPAGKVTVLLDKGLVASTPGRAGAQAGGPCLIITMQV